MTDIIKLSGSSQYQLMPGQREAKMYKPQAKMYKSVSYTHLLLKQLLSKLFP